MKPPVYSGVFRILLLRVLSVNKNFPLRVLTAGTISLFLNITGAIAAMAPVLNTPLLQHVSLLYSILIYSRPDRQNLYLAILRLTMTLWIENN